MGQLDDLRAALARARAQNADRSDPVSPIAPRSRRRRPWANPLMDYVESPEAAAEFDPMAPLASMSTEDIARLQADEMARAASDREARNATSVGGIELSGAALAGLPTGALSRIAPDDWRASISDEILGPLDQPLAFVASGARAVGDEFRAWGGDRAALDRQNDREDMLRRAFRQIGEDTLGEGDQEGMEAFGDAVESDPLGALGSLWTGLSPRGDRRERVYNETMADFERGLIDRDFASLGEPSRVRDADGRVVAEIYDDVAPESDPRRSFDARRFQSAADQALATEVLDTASGALAPLEFAPGGIFDDIISGAANAGRAGRLARRSGVTFTPEEAARLNRDALDDALERPLTREGRNARNWGVAGAGFGAGLGVLADEVFAPEASASDGTEAALPLGAAVTGAVLGAANAVRAWRRGRSFAALRDAETGNIFIGANHGDALAEAEDMAARGEIDAAVPARLEAAYAADPNGADIGFMRGDRFLTRDEGLADLGNRAEALEDIAPPREPSAPLPDTFPLWDELAPEAITPAEELRRYRESPGVIGFQTGRSRIGKEHHPRDLVLGVNEGRDDLDLGLDIGLDPDVTDVANSVAAELSHTRTFLRRMREQGRLSEVADSWRIDEAELARFLDTPRRQLTGKTAETRVRAIADAMDRFGHDYERVAATLRASGWENATANSVEATLANLRTGNTRQYRHIPAELRDRIVAFGYKTMSREARAARDQMVLRLRAELGPPTKQPNKGGRHVYTGGTATRIAAIMNGAERLPGGGFVPQSYEVDVQTVQRLLSSKRAARPDSPIESQTLLRETSADQDLNAPPTPPEQGTERVYGRDDIERLAREIAEAKRAVLNAASPIKPDKTLREWVRSPRFGGLNDPGYAGEIGRLDDGQPGGAWIGRRGGRTIDDAIVAAAEAGYYNLDDLPTPNQFLDDLERDLRPLQPSAEHEAYSQHRQNLDYWEQQGVDIRKRHGPLLEELARALNAAPVLPDHVLRANDTDLMGRRLGSRGEGGTLNEDFWHFALSPRENEMAKLAFNNYSDAQIAEATGVLAETVQTILWTADRKLRPYGLQIPAMSRAAAASAAHQARGAVPIEDIVALYRDLRDDGVGAAPRLGVKPGAVGSLDTIVNRIAARYNMNPHTVRSRLRQWRDQGGTLAALIGAFGAGAGVLAADDAEAVEAGADPLDAIPTWAPWAASAAGAGALVLGAGALRARSLARASEEAAVNQALDQIASRFAAAESPEQKARAVEALMRLQGRTLRPRDRDTIRRMIANREAGRPDTAFAPRTMDRLDMIAPRPRGKPFQDTIEAQARLMAARAARKGVDIEALANQVGVDVVRTARGRVDREATMRNIMRAAMEHPIGRDGELGPVLTHRGAAIAALLREKGLWAVAPIALGAGLLAAGDAEASDGGEDAGLDPLAALGGGTLALGAVVGPGMGRRPRRGIRAYHGSPHDFDRFDISRIGTGEGAQAYGHGLYFAENEGVARGYRDALAPKANVSAGGAPLTQATIKSIADELELPRSGNAAANAFGRLSSSDSIDDYLKKLAQIDINELRKTFPNVADEVETELRLVSELRARGLDIDRPNKGRMYEVNIDADPEDFLDWDAPLRDQPETARQVWDERTIPRLRTRPIGENPNLGPLTDVSIDSGGSLGAFTREQLDEVMARPSLYAPLTGGDLYSDLSNLAPNRSAINTDRADAIASAILRERSIPGIRYLDQGSRGAVNVNDIRGTIGILEVAARKFPDDADLQARLAAAREELQRAEQGLTRNYVLFRDDIIEILRKYGLVGAIGGLGAGALGMSGEAEAIEPAY